MNNIKDIKKLQAYIVIALVIASFSLLSSIIKNMVTERWAKSRDVVACVPADTQNAYPMVYAQTDYHPVQSDALMKSFVEEYVHLSQDDQIINYHAVSKDGRYDNVKLSESRWKAIEMTTDGSLERALAMKRYSDSSDMVQTLKKCDCGWIFLIDDILLYPNVNAGVTIAVVRGEFQVTYDRIKSELPDQLWGYREFTYEIEQGIPTKDTKDNFLNQNGFFIRWSYTRILSSSDREKLSSRNYNYYMKEN